MVVKKMEGVEPVAGIDGEETSLDNGQRPLPTAEDRSEDEVELLPRAEHSQEVSTTSVPRSYTA